MILGYFMIMASIFKRNESKYLISKEQCTVFQSIISKHMEQEHYGEYLVQNIYFDTENWDIIRTSIEKPLYKEKMRLRCYGIPSNESNFFLELKKKYNGIVYKYRIPIPHNDFFDLSHIHDMNIAATDDLQVYREMKHFMEKYNVSGKIYICYRRIAYTGDINLQPYAQSELRVTFDSDIRFRLEKLHFLNPFESSIILPKDKIVMEIKTPGIIPLWMARALSELEIFPMPFSKYGKCYTGYLVKKPEINIKELLSA